VGNLYKSNKLITEDGDFWRCTHGYTQFTDNICLACAIRRPATFAKRRGEPLSWVSQRAKTPTISPDVTQPYGHATATFPVRDEPRAIGWTETALIAPR
jgi:hypothetical protein